jgi:hypothetical protein
VVPIICPENKQMTVLRSTRNSSWTNRHGAGNDAVNLGKNPSEPAVTFVSPKIFPAVVLMYVYES